MKIAIFGGSFNPFTNAHLKNVETLLEQSDIVATVVSTENPHKSNDTMIPYFHRVNMAEIALKNTLYSKDERDYISFARMMMQKYPGPLRSWHFIDWFVNKSHKNYEPMLVFGEDLKEDFEKFERVDFLRENAEILFLPETSIWHATDVRAMIQSGNEEWKTHVPEVVANYIEMHGLYKE